MRRFLLLSLLVVACMAKAESGYTFKLMNKNEVDQEILVSRVVSFYQYLGGIINIEWHRNDVDNTAESVRRILIESGVMPADIVLRKQEPQVIASFPPLLVVKIDTVSAPWQCEYHQNFYKYRDGGKLGCAVDNNGAAALLNKLGRMF